MKPVRIVKDNTVRGVGVVWPDGVVTVRWVVEEPALAAAPAMTEQVEVVNRPVREVIEEGVIVETLDQHGRPHRRPATRQRVRTRWEPQYVRKQVPTRQVQYVRNRKLAPDCAVFENVDALILRGYAVQGGQAPPPPQPRGFFARLFGG